MASDAMLPCPFCGEVPTLIEADENQGLKWGRVRCCIEGPEVRTGYDTSDDAPWHADAIAAWNRRTPAPEVAGSSDREDAERYRWLRSKMHRHVAGSDPAFVKWINYHMTSAYSAPYEMDRDIDAARSLKESP